MKPILFNTAMTKALLDNRKTQTRRPVKPQPPEDMPFFGWLTSSTDGKHIGDACWDDPYLPSGTRHYVKPPCAIGDVLWVRETWKQDDMEPWNFLYKADDANIKGWRPSLHMPRAAARLFLLVTAAKIERIQSITEADAIAEGFNSRAEFIKAWDAIYAKRGYPFEDNPWDWAYTIEKTEAGE